MPTDDFYSEPESYDPAVMEPVPFPDMEDSSLVPDDPGIPSNVPEGEPNRFQFFKVGELTKHLEAASWLIDDFIESSTLTLCFAPPESYKSFLAVDIAASVATGIPWHGLQVKQGAVFYIAGEGIPGLKKRFRAWELAHDIDTERYPLYLSSGAGDFSSIPKVASIVKSMNALCEPDMKPGLIVIDTLARNFGGGNKNDAQAMNLFIRNIDFIRRVWDCSILIVHHTGYASAERGRGSSALRAAVDAEYMITRQKESRLISVKGTKMKDADRPETKNFELRIINLGITDHRGQQITSGVLEETNKQIFTPPKSVRISANHEAVLQAIRSRTASGEPTTRAVILDDLKAQGLNINSFSKWVNKLTEDGLISERNGALYPLVKS